MSTGTIHSQNFILKDHPVFHCHSLDIKGWKNTGDEGRYSIFPAYTQTWDIKAQCIRMHDGVTKGGIAIIPIFPPRPAGSPPIVPFTPVTIATTLAPNVPFSFPNTTGRYPIVQVIDTSTGAVTYPEILHVPAVAPSLIPTIQILNTGLYPQSVFVIIQ